MKRTILVEILLLLSLIILIVLGSWHFYAVKLNIDFLPNLPEEDYFINDVMKTIGRDITYGVIAVIGAILNITVMVITAIKDFPVFKPFVDKMQARRQARKELKAAKAETKKQDKIKALEAELQELKKD